MFIKSARLGDLVNMRVLSAIVMCVQEGYFGTSAFQVILNLQEMTKLKEKELTKKIKNIQPSTVSVLR